jgi:hypothetical protein
LLDQGHAQAAARGDISLAGFGQSGQASQERGFAAAVAGDEAEAVAVGKSETEVLEQLMTGGDTDFA